MGEFFKDLFKFAVVALGVIGLVAFFFWLMDKGNDRLIARDAKTRKDQLEGPCVDSVYMVNSDDFEPRFACTNVRHRMTSEPIKHGDNKVTVVVHCICQP